MGSRMLDNPISPRGHRYECPGDDGGVCKCDKPYRFRRRLIVSVLVVLFLAVASATVWAFVVYAPDLGLQILGWAFGLLMAATGLWALAMAVWGIATGLQRGLWK